MSQWGRNQPWPQTQPQWPQYSQPQGWGTAPAGQTPGYGAPTRAPFGYQQPGLGRPQPKRRGGFGKFLLALVLVPVFFFAALVILGALTGIDDTTPPPQSTGQYENEQYRVPGADTTPPDLPMPETYGDAREWMTNNPIYNQTAPAPIDCDAAPIDLLNASKAELQDHFNQLTGCLMRTFGPAMERADFIPVRPTVTVYTTQIQTPCGKMPRKNAAYCSADQQVYYAADLPSIVPDELRATPYVVESVIAHEFGHAIQGRTGILISEAAWQQAYTERNEESSALEISRRTEVQADCFAGQFIHSVGDAVGVGDTEKSRIGLLFYSIGDDQLTGDPDVVGNHGRGESRITWYQTGLQNTSMGACNSYVAEPQTVR